MQIYRVTFFRRFLDKQGYDGFTYISAKIKEGKDKRVEMKDVRHLEVTGKSPSNPDGNKVEVKDGNGVVVGLDYRIFGPMAAPEWWKE